MRSDTLYGMKSLINWSFQFGVALGACAVIVYISPTPRLDTAAKLAEVVLGFSGLIAAFTYYFERQKDRHQSVAEQIRIFRTEVLESYEKLALILQKEGITSLQRIEKIEEFSFVWLFKNRRNEADIQATALNKIRTNLEKAIYITRPLNALEELSVHMLTRDTVMSDDLISLRPSFIQIVETLATSMTDWVLQDNNMYQGIRKVYELWYTRVDRTPIPEKQMKNEQEKARILSEEK